MQEQLINQLITHLELQGLTFSTENGDPVVMRPIKAKVLLTEIINYLEGAGYVNN